MQAQTQRPTLETPRLVLRPYMPSDALRVRDLAGDRAVAETALNIPHPFERGVAERWIASHLPQWQAGRGVSFAVVPRDSAQLVGGVSLTIEPRHATAEIGYWIGRRHWGRGFATEATQAAVRCAFEDLGLNRLSARHFARNAASGRVLEKVGFEREGFSRAAVRHWDRYEDLVLWGHLRLTYLTALASNAA